MHALIISEKRGLIFERDQEGVYERVWKKKGEERKLFKL